MAPFFKVSEVESHMRESRIKRTKTVCTYCGVGCSFDVWTKDRHILKVEPARAGQWRFHLHQGQVWLGLCQQSDRLTKPLIREGRRVPRSFVG
jgi:formate dehydrogenase major subunit